VVYTTGSCLADTFQQYLGKKKKIQEDITIPQEEIQKTVPDILSLVNGGYLTMVQEVGHLYVCIEFPNHLRVILYNCVITRITTLSNITI
jgi:hypothetical protein